MQPKEIAVRQHTVTEAYLKRFCTPGTDPPMLWDYRRGQPLPNQQQPHDTAVRKNFYNIPDEDGGLTDVVEDFLQTVEGYAMPCFDKLVQDSRSLQPHERGAFAMFVALMQVRTPVFRALAEELVDVKSREKIADYLENDERAGATLRAFNAEKGKQLTLDGVKQWLKNSPPRVRVNKAGVLKYTIGLVDTVTPLVHEMRWAVCTALGGVDFVTSDHPVTLSAPGKDGHLVGWRTPGIEATFPLDSRHCLFMTMDGPEGAGGIKPSGVELVVTRCVSTAGKEVYSAKKNPIVARRFA